MSLVSVVIITHNEENNIVDCIRSARLVTNDIVVVDCGSEDLTVIMAEKEGARTFVIDWQGFGFSRNFGAAQARHDWILALDADERISKELAKKQHWFCMNYYIDEEMLQIKEKNIYTATEVVTLLPLRGIPAFRRFYGHNKWSRTYLPNHSLRVSYIDEVKKNVVEKRF